MSNYTLTQEDYSRLKRRLTTRRNAFTKAQTAVTKAVAAKNLKAEAEYGLRQFEKLGFPDSHHDWTRALEDAEFYISRNA